MNDNFQHEFSDELISAYLDGELAPEQQRRVEEQLMDSAEHRRQFEELKALRRGLQSLPQAALDDQFAQRVLRRAERELLAGAEASEHDESTVDEAKAAAVSGRPLIERRRSGNERGSMRGLIWSIAALAAAVALIVFGPLFTDERQRNVAREEPDGVDQQESREAQIGAPPNIAAPFDPQAAEKSSVSDNAVAPANRRAAEHQTEARSLKAEKARQETSARTGDAQLAARPNEARDRAERLNELAKSRAESLQNQQLRQRRSFADQLDTVDGIRGVQPPANEFARDRKGTASPAHRELSQNGAAESGGRGSAASEQNSAADKVIAMARSDAGTDNTWRFATETMAVVSVDVTQQALSSRLFDRLLVQHGIQMETDVAGVEKETDAALAATEAEERNEPAGRPGLWGQASTPSALKRQRASVAANVGKDVDVMYVVASQAKIERLMRDLREQSADVLAMAYDGPPLKQPDKPLSTETLGQALNSLDAAGRFEGAAQPPASPSGGASRDAEKKRADEAAGQGAKPGIAPDLKREERPKPARVAAENATGKAGRDVAKQEGQNETEETRAPQPDAVPSTAQPVAPSAIADSKDPIAGGSGDGAAQGQGGGAALPAKPADKDRLKYHGGFGYARRLSLQPEGGGGSDVPAAVPQGNNKNRFAPADAYHLPSFGNDVDARRKAQAQPADDVRRAGRRAKAKADEQPLMRVLFVLRAVPATSRPPALPESPAAAAALRENADAAEAPADKE